MSLSLPYGPLVLGCVLVTLVGCSPDPETERLRGTVKTAYDSNEDGNVDTWTYLW